MTVLTICNILMAALEDDPLDDLEQTKGGVLCDRNFDHALASALALREWNVNMELATLAELETAPPHTYDHAYQLPDDLLNLRTIYDPVTRYVFLNERRISGRKLFTDLESPLYIRYGRRLTRTEIDNPLADIYPLDPLFEECVAAKLGTIIGKSLTGEQGDVERMQAWLERVILDAGAIDVNNNVILPVADHDDWVDVN